MYVFYIWFLLVLAAFLVELYVLLSLVPRPYFDIKVSGTVKVSCPANFNIIIGPGDEASGYCTHCCLSFGNHFQKPQCGSMQLSCNITTSQETVSQCNNTHQPQEIQEETHPSAGGEEGREQYTGSNLFSRLASCKYYLHMLFCCCRFE